MWVLISLNIPARWDGLSPTQEMRAWGKLGCPIHPTWRGCSGCARDRACWDLAVSWGDKRGLASKSEWEAHCYSCLLLGGTDWACQELQLVGGGSQELGTVVGARTCMFARKGTVVLSRNS